jgi:hypothetical protein
VQSRFGDDGARALAANSEHASRGKQSLVAPMPDCRGRFVGTAAPALTRSTHLCFPRGDAEPKGRAGLACAKGRGSSASCGIRDALASPHEAVAVVVGARRVQVVQLDSLALSRETLAPCAKQQSPPDCSVAWNGALAEWLLHFHRCRSEAGAGSSSPTSTRRRAWSRSSPPSGATADRPPRGRAPPGPDPRGHGRAAVVAERSGSSGHQCVRRRAARAAIKQPEECLGGRRGRDGR